MLEAGFSGLSESNRVDEFIGSLFLPQDRIGIKINTLGGKTLSTQPGVSLAVATFLTEAGYKSENIIIWDRSERELKSVGYRLNLARRGIKVMATDSPGIGYDSILTSHRNIGSLFSSIQSRIVHSSISLAILKDHGLSGISAGMKNYFGAIHNPNKYHDDNCNPYIAELFDAPPIKKKHKLTILDGLVIQCHRGPAFHTRWAENYGVLVFSQDPVAADFVGWKIIEKLRAQKGLPSLKEEEREPLYIRTAEKMGLGMTSSDKIEVMEEEI